MSDLDATWAERRRRRFMRENAHLHIRHDAWRFMPPGAPRYSGRDVVKYFETEFLNEKWADPLAKSATAARDTNIDSAFEAELRELRSMLAELRSELALRRIAGGERKYNPSQPRVLAGNSGGGQWTSEGVGGDRNIRDDDHVRTAALENLPIGPHKTLKLALEVAKRAIEAFRSENGLHDLFHHKIGVVTYAEVDGKQYFGTNSRSFLFDRADRADTEQLRDILLTKYPERFDLDDNISGAPKNALYHAETNILLRLARDNAGTLAGRKLEIFTDTPLCGNCRSVLPYVGKELGNPTVTFVGPNGRRDTMRDGAWVLEE